MLSTTPVPRAPWSHTAAPHRDGASAAFQASTAEAGLVWPLLYASDDALTRAKEEIMIIRQLLTTLPLALLVCLEVGCGASREIAIKGDVASSSAQLEGPIVVQFFDIVDAKSSLVHTVSLTKAGSFDEKAPVEGKEVLVRAIADHDANGACSAGEAWAEAKMTIKDDDTVDAVNLDLKVGDCPAE
jgi:hypothetical protein